MAVLTPNAWAQDCRCDSHPQAQRRTHKGALFPHVYQYLPQQMIERHTGQSGKQRMRQTENAKI